MNENIIEIIDRIKEIKGLEDDDEVALALGMSKGNLSSYKTRRAVPYEYLSIFCRQEHISLDWLLTGEGEMKRGIYNKEEEKPLKVAEEESPIYNDKEMAEIVDILQKDLPEAKKAVLRLLKYRKGLTESIQALMSIEKPTKEEG